MATMTLTLHEGQTWVYPAITYTSLQEGVYKKQKHWYKNHSVPSKRGVYCYQGGTSDSDGKYNGNMLSIMLFKDSSGRTLKNAIKAIGGSGKITKMTLKMYVHYGWGGYFTPRICATPYWDTSSLTGRTTDSYDGLGFKHLLTTGSLKKSAWHNIDLTSYKSNFDTYESIAFYAPGAYNAGNSSYGCIHSHGGTNKPTLIIEYTTNSAPNTPTTTVTSVKDSNGYTIPALSFKVTNNGDPDNNLHSSPYKYILYNQNGSIIKESGWSSSNTFSYDASSYRGQTIRIRGIVRDTEGLTAYHETNAYINSLPYWSNKSISYSSGVTNGVFKNNITLKWSAATDAQTKHANNLRYAIYVQKGADSGPSGDTSSNCIAYNLTSTNYTVDATSMSQMPVARGERIYFSVWASDGLEYSSQRLTSSWIYREQPPSAVSNVAPTSGHYENSVNVSWSAASGSNGTTIDHYVVKLLNNRDTAIKTYTIKSTRFTCTDITNIPRGEKFKFQVYAVDNLGNTSASAFSGDLLRNSAPTKPLSFKVNSPSTYFKNSIPLIWSASTDKDGDTIRYNVYYSVNGGAYKALSTKLSTTTLNHNVSGYRAGTRFNYYVEAYDTFNIFSERSYIATQPQINITPAPPSITLPYSDRTLYTNVPRIIFTTSDSCNPSLEVLITINGTTYNSKNDSLYFDKSTYSPNQTGMFIVPENTPLNYSKQNTVKIKVFDGLDYSDEKTYNFIVEYPLVEKIELSENRFVKVNELTDLKRMVNATRFAYGLNEISWYTGADVGSKIYKKYYEQVTNNIYDVTTTLNNKVSKTSMQRIYTKDIFAAGNPLRKTMFNNIIDMIIKP